MPFVYEDVGAVKTGDTPGNLWIAPITFLAVCTELALILKRKKQIEK